MFIIIFVSFQKHAQCFSIRLHDLEICMEYFNRIDKYCAFLKGDKKLMIIKIYCQFTPVIELPWATLPNVAVIHFIGTCHLCVRQFSISNKCAVGTKPCHIMLFHFFKVFPIADTHEFCFT